jgi:multiple sugar transport system substrate-binding protein
VSKTRVQNLPELSRRSVLKTSAGAGAALALGGAAALPASQAGAAQEFSGKLTVWGVVSFTEEGDNLLGEQMQEWGEANGVEVEYVALPGSDYATKVAAAVEAGSTPDIVMMIANLAIFYGNQDRLVDLTDVYGELNQLGGGFWEALSPHVTIDGAYISIPMDAEVGVMYSRLDLIEGVTGNRTPPATLDELEEIAGQVLEPPRQFGIGITLGRFPDTTGQVTQIIFADGGTLVDESGVPALNSEGAVTALTRIKRWWDNGLIPPDAPNWDDAGNNTSYQSYQSAFVFNPASILGYLQANDEELLADTAQAKFPEGTAGSFPTSGTWSWSIFNTSENVDAAKALLTHIMQPENVQAVYEKVGGRWYPCYQDLVNEPYWADNPHFVDFPSILESARPGWYPAEGTADLITQLSAVEQKFIIADMVQAVVLNGVAPEQALADAQLAMEQTFEEVASNQ